MEGAAPERPGAEARSWRTTGASGAARVGGGESTWWGSRAHSLGPSPSPQGPGHPFLPQPRPLPRPAPPFRFTAVDRRTRLRQRLPWGRAAPGPGPPPPSEAQAEGGLGASAGRVLRRPPRVRVLLAPAALQPGSPRPFSSCGFSSESPEAPRRSRAAPASWSIWAPRAFVAQWHSLHSGCSASETLPGRGFAVPRSGSGSGSGSAGHHGGAPVSFRRTRVASRPPPPDPGSAPGVRVQSHLRDPWLGCLFSLIQDES